MNRSVIGGNAASIWNTSSGLLSSARPGHIKMIGSEGVTPGYLECNASLQLISAYPDLFAEIGFTWGTGPAALQDQHIQAVADISDSLDGTWFWLWDNAGSIGVWLQV